MVEVTLAIPWRRKIASLNYLLSSHVWRQDHNGFTHQDPGFIDMVVNKKSEVVRVYLPPDANCLLSVMDHCLRSNHYVNVVIAGKHPAPQWLKMEEAIVHCTKGIGIFTWASNDKNKEPDLVMACAGDVPTLETLAAVSILRTEIPAPENPGSKCGGPDETATAYRTSARVDRPRFQCVIYKRQTDDLCLSRLSLADSPLNLPARES